MKVLMSSIVKYSPIFHRVVVTLAWQHPNIDGAHQLYYPFQLLPHTFFPFSRNLIFSLITKILRCSYIGGYRQ